MSPPAVLLRCDAGPRIGAGHFVRCVALAEGVRRAGAEPRLVSARLPDPWRRMVQERGLACDESDRAARGELDLDRLARVAGQAPALVVLDDYAFGAEECRAVRERLGYAAMVRDGGPDPAADAVVDPNLGADSSTYPGSGLRLLGPRYALLREEFREPPPRAPEQRRRARLLVSLGGSATGDILDRLATRLARRLPDTELQIIAPPAGAEHAAGGGARRIEWIEPRSSILSLLLEADLALLAAGGVRFEAARAGCPMLLGVLAENQRADALAFSRLGAAELAGEISRGGLDAIAARAARLMADPDRRARLAGRAADLVDGRGAERAARALLEDFGRKGDAR